MRWLYTGERLGQDFEDWKRFREALLAELRYAFDSMVNHPLRYARKRLRTLEDGRKVRITLYSVIE